MQQRRECRSGRKRPGSTSIEKEQKTKSKELTIMDANDYAKFRGMAEEELWQLPMEELERLWREAKAARDRDFEDRLAAPRARSGYIPGTAILSIPRPRPSIS
jgi:hypothetical protein